MADLTSDEAMTIDHFRDELRDKINVSRKQRRDASVNKNRPALGHVCDRNELTEEFVTTAAKSLKKKALSITEYNKLQNALIQSENHINAFLKVNNAIHGLIRDLSSVSSHLKLSAANCCCNLALGNSKACFTLCKFAAPYLIADLESTSPPLIEVCAWTIGNLVCGSDKTFPILLAQGCMKSLINLAQNCSDELLQAVSYACVRFIHKGVNVIDRSEINNLSMIVSHRCPTVSNIDTMWLLATLSSIPECSDSLMKCTLRLCDYLQDTVVTENDSIERVSAAIRTISNMVSETSGEVANYLLKGDNEKHCTFLGKLLYHQYIHIRQETLWLLGNLCNHHLVSVQQLVEPIVISLPSLKFAVSSLNTIS
ncbi:importin subunit alpha-9 [Copidosoma floridanum]|uniref:importin subunit alpha-9 n=1 Tax=Copidosoma floridanum TaxID=29053 RepID=UPI0006C96461|nr:importin subunit alpha-9 [Copidosoma floridanum]